MEARLFEEGTVPEWSTPEWYAGRERAPHLEQPPHQGRLRQAASYVDEAIAKGAQSVVDLGAGDGGLLSTINTSVPAWGYDLQQSNIEGALERGVSVMYGDVVNGISRPPMNEEEPTPEPQPITWGECAVATEMLEHLIDPHEFVRTIAAHSRWLVASSPAFESAESHYGFHTWAWDVNGYAALVTQGGFEVVKHQIVGDFQVLLAATS